MLTAEAIMDILEKEHKRYINASIRMWDKMKNAKNKLEYEDLDYHYHLFRDAAYGIENAIEAIKKEM